MRLFLIIVACHGFRQRLSTIGGRLRPSKGSESINKGSHTAHLLLRGASHLLRGASQDAESRDAVDGTRERAVPILDTEQWLADVEGSAEPTELDDGEHLFVDHP